VVDGMTSCIKKIEMLAQTLQNKELPEAPLKDTTQQQTPGEIVNILVVNPQGLPAHNTRVKLRPVEFEDANGDGIKI
jgi:hypothetical protein